MNSFLSVFTSLILFLLAAPAIGSKIGDDFKPKKERGSLYERVESLAKNQFARDSNLFQPPTVAQQKAWQRVIKDVLKTRLKEANKNLRKLAASYELILFTDETTNREYVLLQEKTPMQTGWGFYAFDLKTKSHLTIEITHPVADTRTELEGIDVFLQTRARAFLMAGTHRRANKKDTNCTQPDAAADSEAATYPESDVAHSTATIFQTTHESIVAANPKTVAVQLHGMAEREICPNVFISSGTKTITSNSKNLLACLTKQKVEAAIYEGGADGCPLGARTNVQGRFSNGEKSDPCSTAAKTAPEPGFFIHVEQEPNVRRDKDSWQPIIAALKCAFPE